MVNMNKNNPHKRSFPGPSLISQGKGALRLKPFENPWSRSYPVLGGLSQSPWPPCTGLTPLQTRSPFCPRRSQVPGWRRRRLVLPHPSHQRPLPLRLPTAPPSPSPQTPPARPDTPPAAPLPARQAAASIHLSSCPALSSPRGLPCAGWTAWLMRTSPGAGRSMARGSAPRAPVGRPLPAGRSAAGAPGGNVRRQEYREEGDRRFCPTSSQI